MKTEISRDSHQVEKRYSGVYQQQGRMLTDADWNELVEILKARLNEALKDVIGGRQGSVGGTPRSMALRIVDDGGIKIQPGHIYIDGMAAALPGDGAFEFNQQPDFPISQTPTGDYLLYADVWERTVTQLMDERLRDKGLHGADTCSRKQVLAQIKWCPTGINPEEPSQNPGKGNAGLTLTLRQKTTAPDICDPCAEQLDIDTRVGNYLFRAEVHDVSGDADNPSGITLKWSSENGAEQFPALITEEEMPAGFISDKWVYEFFDETSERHLGVHLNTTTWQPVRAELRKFNETSGAYSVPVIPGSKETRTFVRRWDGYCKLDLTTNKLLEGMDRGVELAADKTADSLGYVGIGSTLKIALDSLILELELTGKSFVAGDFWMADVREAEHDEGSVLAEKKVPQGIKHYYLILGRVSGGTLLDNPEIDRKYAFPPLTQMTRLFMAGGDGQEIVPGQGLPAPLCVGVANGEWPVEGATVRFTIEAGGGSLDIIDSHLEEMSDETDENGIAKCEWFPNAKIGATCRVKASLVDPNNTTDPPEDFTPPVYFYANLVSADQVAYAPECQPDRDKPVTVHHLLLGPDASRIGNDKYYTVKEVLDALLCELKADHLPYDDPGCDGQTVRALLNNLDFDQDKLLSVKDVLDTLLCKLQADKLPYDAAVKTDCWQRLNLDGEAGPPQTVQQAVDVLACSVQKSCCSITILPGDDIKQKLSVIEDGRDAEICFQRGEHFVQERIELVNKGRIVIHGCGPASRVLAPNSESVFRIDQCESVYIHDLAMLSSQSGDSDKFEQISGTLDIVDVDIVSIDQVDLTCPASDARRSACCLRVMYSRPENPRASVRIRRSRLNPGHQQTGLLMVNAGRAQIEDNEIRVRPKSRHWVLKDRLQEKTFRQVFRKILISNLSFSKTSRISAIQRNASITFEGKRLYFSTDPKLVKDWGALFDENKPEPGTSGHGLIRHMKVLADTILLNQGWADELGKPIEEFREWYQKISSNLPAIASQGIVCGGRSGKDIRILNNTMAGVGQGVHIGLSDKTTKEYSSYTADRIQIKGNHITNFLSAEYQGERHGIFVGNCNSLDIESNYLNVEFFPFDKTRAIDGIRIYGFAGKLILVRHNHANGYGTGIFVRILDSISDSHVWQVVSNVFEAANTRVAVRPQSQFMVENNA